MATGNTPGRMPAPPAQCGDAHTVELGEDAVQHDVKYPSVVLSVVLTALLDLLMPVLFRIRSNEPEGRVCGTVCGLPSEGPAGCARALSGLSRSAALRARGDTQPSSSCCGLAGA